MMKKNSLYVSLFASITTLLAVGSVPLHADSLKNEILSQYPILRGDAVVESAQSEYDAACAAIRAEEDEKIAAVPTVEWTDEDADSFWDRIAESATRTSTAPRLGEADAQGGEGILETFGTRYMPNEYAVYQEARATAKEREQLLAENFPNGRASDVTGGGLYDKVSKACAKAVSEMFRRHDELCHFYLLHRVGAMTEAELSALDAKPIRMPLPAQEYLPPPYTATHETPSSAERDFLEKYLPESWKAYQHLQTAFTEGKATYAELRETAIRIDATRAESILRTLPRRLDNLREKMAHIVQTAKEQKLLHAVGKTTAAQLAEKDRRNQTAVNSDIKPVAYIVRTSVDLAMIDVKAPQMSEKQRMHDSHIASIHSAARQKEVETKRSAINKCVRVANEKAEAVRKAREEAERVARAKAEAERIAREEAERKAREEFERIVRANAERERKVLNEAGMVTIPGKNFSIGKYEVTQSRWEAVMGTNPSYFKGADNPVERVSWDDCQEFLEKLNALPAVKESGLVFRLPTEAEWEYASRAGAAGGYCKLADGTEITEKTLGQVAWFGDNSSKRTHPVGQKEPNAFGLYDTLGNVTEWTQTADALRRRAVLGGSWIYSAWACVSTNFGSFLNIDTDERDKNLGFRLCASGSNASIQALLSSMVRIPGKTFSMAKYEVTQSQWEAVMGKNPSDFEGSDNPVECVSWNDCQEFLKKLNGRPDVKASGLVFRLPTVGEWEYACRAGATSGYCKLADGTEITSWTLGRVAWNKDNSDDKTHPVGQKQPNAFGLYDMHGNVFEWTQTAVGEKRVLSGGSWNSPVDICESSKQFPFSADTREDDGGVRLCADKRQE